MVVSVKRQKRHQEKISANAFDFAQKPSKNTSAAMCERTEMVLDQFQKNNPGMDKKSWYSLYEGMFSDRIQGLAERNVITAEDDNGKIVFTPSEQFLDLLGESEISFEVTNYDGLSELNFWLEQLEKLVADLYEEEFVDAGEEYDEYAHFVMERTPQEGENTFAFTDRDAMLLLDSMRP